MISKIRKSRIALLVHNAGGFFRMGRNLPIGLLDKLLEKLAPFEKFRSVGKEEVRPGGIIMENCWKRSGENFIFCINFVDYKIMHCDL